MILKICQKSILVTMMHFPGLNSQIEFQHPFLQKERSQGTVENIIRGFSLGESVIAFLFIMKEMIRRNMHERKQKLRARAHLSARQRASRTNLMTFRQVLISKAHMWFPYKIDLSGFKTFQTYWKWQRQVRHVCLTLFEYKTHYHNQKKTF